MGNRKQRLEKIGPLDCVYLPGEEGGPLIVFFHGYGADAWDLAPLSHELGVEGATWVFPNGTLEVPIGPGWTGRAWFQIDVQGLEKAMAAGTHREMSDLRPPEMDRVLLDVQKLFQALGPEDYSKVIVGGFSQGAMLSTEAILSTPMKVDGAVLLSGTLLDQAAWREKVKNRVPVDFFQSHGTQDALLSFSAAQKLEQLLREGGWRGHLRAFRGGHEIPFQVLTELKAFIHGIIQGGNKNS
ncbi:MAG: serine esterase [Bdellovibrionales bacterium]|nr:serine esterase [Bdellovibrionales bacterium]